MRAHGTPVTPLSADEQQQKGNRQHGHMAWACDRSTDHQLMSKQIISPGLIIQSAVGLIKLGPNLATFIDETNTTTILDFARHLKMISEAFILDESLF